MDENMTSGIDPSEGAESFVLAVVNLLIENVRSMARIVFTFLVLGLAFVLLRPRQWTSEVRFVPQASESSASGLARLAGQFGIVASASTAGWTSAFYVELLESPGMLRAIAADTIPAGVLADTAVLMVNFLDHKPSWEYPARVESAMSYLKENVLEASEMRQSGTVRLIVNTENPDVSAFIATRLLASVVEFNQAVRQSQAAEERRFVEQRLVVAREELLEAENRLERFLRTNRTIGSSPELAFDRDRLMREVTLRQGVVSTLVQAFEDARIREVRATPVVTVTQAPVRPILPERRRGVLWLAVFGFFGSVVAMSYVGIRQRWSDLVRAGAPEAQRTIDLMSELLRFLRLKQRGQ